MALYVSRTLVTALLALVIGVLTPLTASAQKEAEPCNNQGCGCGNPPPLKSTGYGPCGCFGREYDNGCGCGSPVKNLGCGCGQSAPSAYVCNKCFDNTSCLGCDKVPYSGKVDVGCGCGIAKNTDGCCPGTFAFPGDNTCKTQDQICKSLFSQIIQVQTVRFHPDVTPKWKETSALYHMTASGGVPFQNANDVNVHSSCLYSAMSACSGGNVPYALTSRLGNGDVDECVADVLRRWSPAMAYQGKTNAFGVSTDVWATSAYVMRNAAGGCGPAPTWAVSLRDRLNCSVLYYHYHEFSSPVSLLWTDDVDINEVTSYSKFPLNPSAAGRTTLWRGSGMTPLVAYDPRGTGVISDATQLFGNHTFGKKWDDGYAALASLDKETKDGWLEGKELAGIVLWFDHNRDGISQLGEVKTLKEVGITAIGVKSDRKDAKTKSIFASKGFRRVIEGKEMVGRSVDWFGAPLEGDFTKKIADFEAEKIKPLDDFVMPGNRTLDITATMHGVWQFQILDDKKLIPEQRPGGILAITQDGDRLRGASLASAIFMPNAYGIDERIDAKRLVGVATTSKPGEAAFEFIVGISEGVEAKSVAKLSADGMKLVGETTQPVEFDGKTQSVTYHWEASRVAR